MGKGVSKEEQSRFNNRELNTQELAQYTTAREAAQYLGVKRATLYTYVSRGWIQTLTGDSAKRSKLYLRADVERLKIRQRARAGHGAVAGGALRWGEPVLETRISNIEEGLLSYRGHPINALAGLQFEQVAELLWSEQPTTSQKSVIWPKTSSKNPQPIADFYAPGSSPLVAMSVMVALLGAHDVARFAARPAAELARGRMLIRELAALLGSTSERIEAARLETTMARTVAVAAGCDPDRCAEAMDTALVMCAEHGLNASTFAARVVSATGADLYACLQSGFGALSGPRHGGACDRIDALLDEVGSPEKAQAIVSARLQRGEGVAGFHHPLYPGGDPRTGPLMAHAVKLGGDQVRFQTAVAVAEVMEKFGHSAPAVDFGLVALAAALDLPKGSAVAIFGVGRCAGWIAHILEQRRSQALIRPRARYIGA